MPRHAKTPAANPLARDAAWRHTTEDASCSRQKGQIESIWDMSGILAAAVLPSRAIGAVLAIVVVVGGPESRQ